MFFRKLEEIPDEYQELVEQLVNRGIIVIKEKEFEFPLNMEMLYLIKIMQRMI